MDRSGYDTGGAHKPLGETIKHIPGTEEHRLHEAGMVGEGHRSTGAGYGHSQGPHIACGTGYGDQTGIHYGPHNTGTGYGEQTGIDYGAGRHTGPTPTERVKQAIPGTREYEAAHGTTGAHRAAEQAKAYIPGTGEHEAK